MDRTVGYHGSLVTYLVRDPPVLFLIPVSCKGVSQMVKFRNYSDFDYTEDTVRNYYLHLIQKILVYF